jgi:hypothetical protein
MVFTVGLMLVGWSFVVRTSATPSDIEATTAHLSALLGDRAHEEQLVHDAETARNKAGILLLCGLASAVVGPIFIVAGVVAARGTRSRD